VTRRELLFSAAGDAGQVFAALSTRYTVLAAPATSGSWTCLDTPDWRLHKAGLTLRDARTGRRAELVLSNGSGAPEIAVGRVRTWPARVDALPAGNVHDRVAAAVGVRALVPMAQVDVRSIPMTLQDENAKIRVRIRVDLQRLQGGGHQPLPLRVIISPLRGYDGDADRCAAILDAALPRLETTEATATIAMSAAGHVPGEMPTPALELDPAAPAAESVAIVLISLLGRTTASVPGVLADLDTEYLHDLRTSVRATRSVLRQAGEVLPSSQVRDFAAEFSWLAGLTSPVRDADVMLQLLAGSEGVQVGDLDALAPLTRFIATRRARAQRVLRDGLESARYGQLVANWRSTLRRAQDSEVATAPLTAIYLAELAGEAYDRIRHEAAEVTERSEAAHLHKLRKDCKQMRYLLDTFASAYSPAPLGRALKSLKRLQNTLGTIQDSAVQRALLTDSVAALTKRGIAVGDDVETTLQAGALRERIALRDAQAREELLERLNGFCGKNGRATIRGLRARTAELA
jgi:CHAD domain-containing protein